MAHAPSLAARVGGIAARTGATRLWWAALVAGVTLCVAYAAIPVEHVVVRDFVLYPLTDLGAALAIVIGVRLYRPDAPWAWLLIAACLLFFMAGDLTWGVYEAAGQSPTASLADVFYLAGYPCVLAGLLIAIRRRSPSRDWRELIDSAIVGTSAFLLLWVYIVNPYALGGLGWKDALASIAYPVADTVVLAAVVRLMLAGDWNVPALRLLFLGLALTLAGDIAYADNNIGHIRLVDTLLQLGIVAIGLAGLHRSMPALTTSSEAEQTATGGIVRLVLLVGVCAVPLIVLAVQAIDNYGLHLVAVIVTLAVLAMLVVARSVGLTITAEQAADREATLSRYAAELLRTDGRAELLAVAGRTASDLAGAADASIVELGGEDAVRAAHTFTTPVEVRGEVAAYLVADGKEPAVRRLAGSLKTVAAQLSLALERDRLLETERETAEALARRNEELRELDHMKDLFVRGVSHELRTPLTSMIGFVELLRRGDVGALSDDQQRFLEIVERNGHRLSDLIDDILFVSRVDTGRLPLERSSVDLGELVADRVESIRAAADLKGVDVQLRLDGVTSRLWADPSRLAQLLDNLLSNAVKFTAAGGEIVVRVSAHDETAHVQVDDTGVGIPKEETGRLFERFFRASTARDIQGTGLGLAIAKSIVEAHGGTISVHSDVGVGTTVAVDLPFATQPAVAADDPAEEVTA
jgi:signal transduction histidine kinase